MVMLVIWLYHRSANHMASIATAETVIDIVNVFVLVAS
jgi:hypothetical protein